MVTKDKPPVSTHIWLCLENPKKYWSMDVDNLTWIPPEIFEAMVEQFNRDLPTDHVHIFGERESPKGNYVFHECPGKQQLQDIVDMFIKLGEGHGSVPQV